MTDERRLKYELTADKHVSIFRRRIVPKLFAGAKTATRARAIIYGGQPGAGKSNSVDEAMAEFPDRSAAAIIGDDLRAYHPHYETLLALKDETAAFYTDADTARWVEMAIDHAKRNRFSMVIEGTMRNVDKVAATMTSLRSQGYSIDARILVVKYAFSWQGVVERYETQKADKGYGRMTTRKAHDAAYDGMITTVDRIESEKLADSITLLRRAGAFYRRQLVGGKWSTRRTATATIADERKRTETNSEIRELIDGYARIERLLKRPERNASVQDLEALDALSKDARSMLIADSDPEESERNRDDMVGRRPEAGRDPFE